MHSEAAYALLPPTPSPFVGQHHLGTLGPGVRGDAAVLGLGHFEVIEIEALRVHAARGHGDDHGVLRREE